LLEFDQRPPESYYINMLATNLRFREPGIGRELLVDVEKPAISADCRLIGILVFAINQGRCAFTNVTATTLSSVGRCSLPTGS
jgi:hypothetical protein